MRAHAPTLSFLALVAVACAAPPATTPTAVQHLEPDSLGRHADGSARCNGAACDDACRDGDAASCMHRAAELQDRLDTSLNDEITRLLVRACDGGDAQGCLELAVHCGRLEDSVACLEVQIGLLPEARRAECASTGERSCLMDGRRLMYERGQDRASRACAHGVARTCFLCGYIYEAGYNLVERDPGTAAQWYREGCNAGDPDSCDSLAIHLRKEPSTRAEDAEHANDADRRAAKLRQEACDDADALACMALARTYASGNAVVPRDDDRADRARRRACELDLDDRACR